MGSDWERENQGDRPTRMPMAAQERAVGGGPAGLHVMLAPKPPTAAPGRRLIASGLASLAVAVLLVVLLRAPLSGLFAAHPHPSSAPVLAGPTMPAFSDWRVAYAGSDGHLHVVSLDGKTDLDLSGKTLPLLDASTDGNVAGNQESFAVSPSGKAVAYTDTYLALIELRAGGSYGFTGIKDMATDVTWSPDGSLLAYGDRTDRVVVMRYPSLDEKTYLLADPQAAATARVQPLGWQDASHVVVELGTPSGIQFEALDIVTGQTRPIATLPGAGLGTQFYSLSPDGRAILVSNSAQGQDHGRVTPYIKLIATATGQARTLQSAMKLTGEGITAAAWKPGTALVAVAGGDPGPAGAQIELLDTQRDSMRPLGATGFPEAWAPDGGRLIVSASGGVQPGAPPHAILALTVPATGAATATTLTSSAATFPLLGLVRTA